MRTNNLSLPITLSTAENLGFSPDGRNRYVPVRVPLAAAGCDPKLRRMEFLVGTGKSGLGLCRGPIANILGFDLSST
jgi:hypothetical protein